MYECELCGYSIEESSYLEDMRFIDDIMVCDECYEHQIDNARHEYNRELLITEPDIK